MNHWTSKPTCDKTMARKIAKGIYKTDSAAQKSMVDLLVCNPVLIYHNDKGEEAGAMAIMGNSVCQYMWGDVEGWHSTFTEMIHHYFKYRDYIDTEITPLHTPLIEKIGGTIINKTRCKASKQDFMNSAGYREFISNA